MTGREREGLGLAPEQPAEPESDSETIGRMARDEPIHAAMIVIDIMQLLHESWLVARTRTADEWLDEATGNLIGQDNQKHRAEDTDSEMSPEVDTLVFLAIDDHLPQEESVERNPGEFAGVDVPQLIPERTTVAIEEQHQLLIERI